LQCHENGGFVQKFNAYAPVTPHPEMINCRQCHVTQNVETFFTEIDFAKVQTPEVGVNNALPGSPPVIPHQIQMRENCLSCHAGPAAPKEIRVTHPERINCRQCHIPSDKAVTDIEVFTRANTTENE
jgi:cytochrome c-type protein NapB